MSRRPWKAKKKDLENMKKWAGQGMTIEQIGASLGITGKTIWAKIREEPRDNDGMPDGAISTAIKEGKAKAIVEVTGKLYKIAMNDKHRGQTTANIFWLKNVAKWRDRQVVEGDPDNPIPVEFKLKIKSGRARDILDLVRKAHAPRGKQKSNRKSKKRPKKKSKKRPKR